MQQAKSVREWLLQFDAQAKTPATHTRTHTPCLPVSPRTPPFPPVHPLHHPSGREACHLLTPRTPPLHPSQAEKLVIPAMRRAMASGDGGGKKHAVGSGAYKSLV